MAEFDEVLNADEFMEPSGVNEFGDDGGGFGGVQLGGVFDGLDAMGGFDDVEDGFESLNEVGDFFMDDVVGDGEGGPAIALRGDDFERFKWRFQDAFRRAQVTMAKIHDDTRLYREICAMLPLEPAYEGGPNIRTPLTANKTEGVIAHMRDAVEQNTIFSVTSQASGSASVTASFAVPLVESLLEREINSSGSREKLVGDSIKEAARVGTAIARLSVARVGDEVFQQVSDLIPLERFYVDRVEVTNLNHVTCFYTFEERLYNLEDWAERGMIDKDALEEVRPLLAGSLAASVDSESDEAFVSSSRFEEENQLVELVRGYMRFRAEGGRSELYECLMTRNTMDVLAVRLNPFNRAFDKPPILLWRVGARPNYLFGVGMAERLHPQQLIADNAINTHIALNNLAASPPFVYSAKGAFGQIMSSMGSSGIVPGMGIPVDGTPNDPGFQQLDIVNRGYAVQDYGLAQEMASHATFSEESLGSPSGNPRKTYGQFSIEAQKGTIRLRSDLSDFAYDAAENGEMLLAALLAFKLQPAGVMEVSPGGKLISFDELRVSEWLERLQELAGDMQAAGEVADAGVLLQEWAEDRLTSGTIPFARRGDLKISLRGTRIIADKLGELDALMNVALPLLTSFTEAARQDVHSNRFMRQALRAANVENPDLLVPPEPSGAVEGLDARRALMDPMIGLLETQSRR